MRWLAAIGLALTLSAHAGDRATEAAIEDLATTGVGIALGAAEMNPAGLVVIPLKFALLSHAESLPDGDKQHQKSVIASVWRGAAANNVCVIASIVTGGTFAPACVAIGLIAGVHEWQAGADERTFWRICQHEKLNNPNLVCKFHG